MSRASSTAHSSAVSPSIQLYPQRQDAPWEMDSRSTEQTGFGHYPIREGEPDCTYYIQTGMCRYGATCRYNHPPVRKLAIAMAQMKGEYPERIGQPECQYYIKTGTCKFGATCKFHHPRDKAWITERIALNVLGYPLRPNEIDCAYYMRHGICKFGSTCKFNHPQPSNMMVPVRGSDVYPTMHSPTGQVPYSLSRPSYLPSPRWQSPSNGPLVMLPGMLPVPTWNTYSGQLGSILSSDHQHTTPGNIQNEGASKQGEGRISGSVPIGYYGHQGENVFPERPGQPECQFYMKTGDCKFGAVCKFHHPRDRTIPAPNCSLSPIGLPLRQGEPLCVFYSRYGICKFGPSCKFDHPMRIFTYDPATTSRTDSSIAHNFLASSPGTIALSFFPDKLVEAGATSNWRLSLSESRQQKSSGDSSNIHSA